ncbi:EVE domain-containing protein [Kiloniella sp. b19]|uniref:EVE domain-containing protein n=1 Tax=Kiloniella sp. GXU_MW_B19 TaxID=3141326 RepID=UPI0031D79EAE
MAYWLMKSEPASWSWQDQLSVPEEPWNGVRNYQAANNMKAMELGDRAFFYHSVKEKAVVGIVKISKLYHPDPSDQSGRFGMVSVKAVESLPQPVTLEMIKQHESLSGMALLRQSRLSVSPVTEEEWSVICKMGGL